MAGPDPGITKDQAAPALQIIKDAISALETVDRKMDELREYFGEIEGERLVAAKFLANLVGRAAATENVSGGNSSIGTWLVAIHREIEREADPSLARTGRYTL